MNTSNQVLIKNAICNTNINSTQSVIVDIYGFCIQAVITGTPTGTLKLQASSDALNESGSGRVAPAINWTDVANSSFAITTSGNTVWNYNGAFFNFVRVVYLDSSGGTSTAVLNVNINVKGP